MGIGGVVIGILVIGGLMGKWVDPRVRPAHAVGVEISVLMDEAHLCDVCKMGIFGTVG